MIEQLNKWYNDRKVDWIDWLPVVGLLLLISAIPFGWSSYQRICLYILGVGYVLDYIVRRRWLQLKWDRSKWIYVVMLYLWVLPYIRHLFDPTAATDYFWHQMHVHEWFGYVGVIGLLGFSPKLRMQHVAWVMLATSVAMALYCSWLFLRTDEFIDVNGDWLIRFDLLRQTHINSHMVMNLYINTAIILGLLTMDTMSAIWKKILMVCCIVIAIGLIFLTFGRVGQATTIWIIGGYSLYKIRRLSKLWFWVALPFICLCMWGALHVNERFDMGLMQKDPRLAIWDFSIRKIQQEPLTGYGYASLDSVYLENQYTDSVAYSGFVTRIMQIPDFAIQGKTLCTHHPHNAFLLYWLAMGIPGLIGLVLLFVVGILLPTTKGTKFYLLLFLLAFLTQCMTEPIGRHLLPQFFCIILFVWQRTSCAIDISADQL